MEDLEEARRAIAPNFGERQMIKQGACMQAHIRLRGNKEINIKNYCYIGCSPRVACPPSLAQCMYLFHLLSSYFAWNFRNYRESTMGRKGIAIKYQICNLQI